MSDKAHAHSRVEKLGLPPGTPVYVGEQPGGEIRVTQFAYNDTECVEQTLAGADLANWNPSPQHLHWINVDGVHDVALVETIGARFHLHALLLEDIVNTTQRAKFEDYDDCLYVVLRMLTYNDATHAMANEQVSLVIGKHYVLTFQEERQGDVFDPIRGRLRAGKSRMRKQGADYLAYALMDAIVDHYFIVLEKTGEHLAALQDHIEHQKSPRLLVEINRSKRSIMSMRFALWPARDVASGLLHCDSNLISRETHLYLRDLHDHAIRAVDTLEAHRDLTANLTDIYFSLANSRLNEVMKVLTIIATIFIPLTFIAGIYGMNFDYMPELRARWGYPVVLLFMAMVAGGMLVYFKKKKWL